MLRYVLLALFPCFAFSIFCNLLRLQPLTYARLIINVLWSAAGGTAGCMFMDISDIYFSTTCCISNSCLMSSNWMIRE